ncbi:squalene synthase HpnC [Actinomycetospora chiangmaiensis]|uniref:squalene synthase HpnC n=1 Tax=Actinomycetospora chiangmaiensis TaxID=402650 RepID=UPI00035DF4E1|nr:squalene synthase HpnC [Actinomycetospora chiangmaiensis]
MPAGPSAPTGPATRLAQAEGAENFPVALRVLPAARRAELRAVYAVVRTVDDVGDEGDAAPADRLAALDALDADVRRVFAGEPAHHPVVAALAPHVARLPEAPFHDLVAANRQDQHVTAYATHDELLASCRLSAVPIGRLVLAVFAVPTTPSVLRASDAVCTALQLLEHLADVGEDRRRGRIYLPADAMTAAGVTPADLDAPVAADPLRRLVLARTAEAQELLTAGDPLVAHLHGPARLAVAGYAAGGHAAADALRRTGGDVLGRTARTRRRDVARHLLRLLVTRARATRPAQAEEPR